MKFQLNDDAVIVRTNSNLDGEEVTILGIAGDLNTYAHYIVLFKNVRKIPVGFILEPTYNVLAIQITEYCLEKINT